MISGSASNGGKLTLGGCYPSHVNAGQAVSGSGGFLGALWLPQCLMAVPPSAVSEHARACSCAAKVFPDFLCQKNKDVVPLQKQVKVGRKLISWEKWQIVWESGRLVGWH